MKNRHNKNYTKNRRAHRNFLKKHRNKKHKQFQLLVNQSSIWPKFVLETGDSLANQALILFHPRARVVYAVCKNPLICCNITSGCQNTSSQFRLRKSFARVHQLYFKFFKFMMIIFGIIGLLIISFSIWLKNERLQDVLFVAGGISLLVYSIHIKDVIFIILQVVFIASALVELLQLKQKTSRRNKTQ